jgi:hypothetical protein
MMKDRQRYAVVAYGEDGWLKLNSGDNKNSMAAFMSMAKDPDYFAEGTVRLESIRLVDFEEPRCSICNKTGLDVEGDEWLEVPGWYHHHRICADRLHASIERNREAFAQAVLSSLFIDEDDPNELWDTLRQEAEANYREAVR